MNSPANIVSRPAVDLIYDRDFIAIYRALDPQLCRAIIERFDRDPDKWRGRIGKAADFVQEEETKNSWDLGIPNAGAWEDIFRRIHPLIQTCIGDYLSRSPILQSFNLEGSGYKIQMYPQNEGHFRWHADAVGRDGADRVIGMVLYLNDVAQGGETEFFHQDIKIIPKAGHLAVFPAAWNYMHCAHKPESGDKYVISSFIRFKD